MESKQGSAALVLEESKDRIVSKLHEVLRPFLLRRLKDDVLEIKSKREIVVYAPLTESQVYFYQAIRDKRLTEVLGSVAAAQKQKVAYSHTYTFHAFRKYMYIYLSNNITRLL